MPEEIVEKFDKVAGRRSFLVKLSAAAAALVMSLFNIRGAQAQTLFPVACCTLCKDPRTCTYGGCVCQWFWQCFMGDGTVCQIFTCWECYGEDVTGACEGGCAGIKCSRATYTTIRCKDELPEKPPKKE